MPEQHGERGDVSFSWCIPAAASGKHRLSRLAAKAFGSRKGQAGWQVGLPHQNAAGVPTPVLGMLVTGSGQLKIDCVSCTLLCRLQSPPELKTTVHTVDPSIDSTSVHEGEKNSELAQALACQGHGASSIIQL